MVVHGRVDCERAQSGSGRDSVRKTFILLFITMIAPVAGHSAGEEPLLKELGCGHCHAGVELPEWSGTLPQIHDMGRRYQPQYLLQYLAAPTAQRHI